MIGSPTRLCGTGGRLVDIIINSKNEFNENGKNEMLGHVVSQAVIHVGLSMP